MRNRGFLAVLAVLAVGLSVVLTGCGGSSSSSTLKIVSDLPLQGSDRVQTEQMVRAIQFVLEQAGGKAGDYSIEFTSNDDSTAAAGKWDEAKCSENARSYADDSSIVGVIGTYNSGCAAIEIPILNEGPVAMVSPANTYTGLTKGGPGTEAGEPDKYYPSGTRNYARVVASDDNQGRIGAQYMKDVLGVTSVYILDDKELYGKGVADSFEGSANDIGLKVAGHEGWDKDAQNYTSLMTKIKASGADGIYIGGISTNNGGQLVKDKVQVVGDNEKVKMVVSDGFVLSSLFDEAGADNVQGAYGTAPTSPPDKLTGLGKTFVDDFQQAEGGKPLEVYTIYAAAAAQVLLDAISRSDGSREDVIAKLYETNLPDTVVGPMSFNDQGDPNDATETVYLANNGAWEFKESKSLSS